MKSNQNSYGACRSKIVEAFKNWNIGLLSDTPSLSEAGICIEQILKACVLLIVPRTELEIEDFNITIYTLLKKKGYFDANHDLGSKTFGIKGCMDLIKGNKSNIVLPKDVDVFIYDINKIYNTHKHAIKKGDPISEEISSKLYYVVDWFFNLSDEPNWKKDFYEGIDIFIENFASRFAGKTADKIVEVFRKDNESIDNERKKQYEVERKREQVSADLLIKKRKYWIIAILSLFAAMSVVFLKQRKSYLNLKIQNGIESQYFDSTKNTYNVLLLKFDTLSESTTKRTHLETIIKGRLEELSEKDGLNLQVKFNSRYIVHTVKDADSLGRKFGANLVIWGDSYESDNQARLRYVNVTYLGDFIGPKTGETKTEAYKNLSEIKDGKLQRDVDCIIYWVTAFQEKERGNYKQAKMHFKQLESKGDTNGYLYSYLGLVSFGLIECNDAVFYYKKSIGKTPTSNSAAYLNLSSALSLCSNYNLNDRIYFEKALELNPNSADCETNYALFLNKNPNNLQEVTLHMIKALKIDSTNSRTHYAFATICLRQHHDTLKAKFHLENSCKYDPVSGEKAYTYATLLYVSKDFQRAKFYIERTIYLEPQNVLARAFYAKLLDEEFNDFSKAKYQYEIAINLDPNNIPILDGYAHVLQKLNLLDAAITVFQKALNIDPLNFQISVHYIELLINMNNLEMANTQFQIVLHNNPKNISVLNNYMNFLFFKMNDKIKAKEVYIKIITLYPNEETKEVDTLLGLKWGFNKK